MTTEHGAAPAKVIMRKWLIRTAILAVLVLVRPSN